MCERCGSALHLARNCDIADDGDWDIDNDGEDF